MGSPRGLGGMPTEKKQDKARHPLDTWSYFTGAQRAVSGVQEAGLEEANRKPQNIHRKGWVGRSGS